MDKLNLIKMLQSQYTSRNLDNMTASIADMENRNKVKFTQAFINNKPSVELHHNKVTDQRK